MVGGFVSAVELAAALRAGAVRPAEVVGACLERIERSQPVLNTYVTVTRDEAMRHASRVETLDAALPLRGVPFSVKDNIETLGTRTTFGSKTLAANMAGAEAIAVRRLRAAGGVFVGKTTLPEFASTVLSESPLTGVTRNPWNTDYTPGGSSSGAAAAVAAGLEPIALTTDAGASTRLPAAICGVLGMKPSMGLVPYAPFPDGFGNFIHMGLITRTVADLALALDCVSGEDAADPQSIGIPQTRALAALQTPFALAGQRIAWRAFLGNKALEEEVRDLCEATLQQLRLRGASVEAFDGPWEPAAPTWRVLQQMNWLGRFGQPDDAAAAQMDPGFVAGVRAGAATTGPDLNAAIYKRSGYFHTVQAWFERFDWIATPVTTLPAVPLSHKGDTPLVINGKPAGELRAAWGPYLNVFNLTGHPALAIPAGFTRAGLPVGIQLVGRLYADVDLLRIARIIEETQPWAARRPPIHYV